MNDRELLEMAAKAAGMQLVADHAHIPSGGVWLVGKDEDQVWSPLTDDGDALRLAVKLRMIVDPDGAIYEVATATPKATGVMAHEKHRADPYAATRRAIVRAAAEIGRAM